MKPHLGKVQVLLLLIWSISAMAVPLYDDESEKPSENQLDYRSDLYDLRGGDFPKRDLYDFRGAIPLPKRDHALSSPRDMVNKRMSMMRLRRYFNPNDHFGRAIRGPSMMRLRKRISQFRLKRGGEEDVPNLQYDTL